MEHQLPVPTSNCSWAAAHNLWYIRGISSYGVCAAWQAPAWLPVLRHVCTEKRCQGLDCSSPDSPKCQRDLFIKWPCLASTRVLLQGVCLCSMALLLLGEITTGPSSGLVSDALWCSFWSCHELSPLLDVKCDNLRHVKTPQTCAVTTCFTVYYSN